MIAFVREVISDSTWAGSRLKVLGSMSAKTGVPPASATEFAVAAKEKEGTITSSPVLIPAAIKPIWCADVPELNAIQ